MMLWTICLTTVVVGGALACFAVYAFINMQLDRRAAIKARLMGDHHAGDRFLHVMLPDGDDRFITTGRALTKTMPDGSVIWLFPDELPKNWRRQR